MVATKIKRNLKRKVYIKVLWLTHTRSKLPANRICMVPLHSLRIKGTPRSTAATTKEKLHTQKKPWNTSNQRIPLVYFMKLFTWYANICAKRSRICLLAAQSFGLVNITLRLYIDEIVQECTYYRLIYENFCLLQENLMSF